MSFSWNPVTGLAGCNTVALIQPSTSLTKQTLNLNSAYTYNSAGAGFMYSFMCSETGNLTDFYCRLDSLTSYPGTTDGKINVEIRLGGTGTRQPSSTLVSSFTISVSAAGWVNASGLSIALTAGTIYTVVIADADGNASNFATLVTSYSTINSNAGIFTGAQTATTANGFSSAGTQLANTPVTVMKINGLLFSGNAFDTIVTVSSSTNERGVRFIPSTNCVLVGGAMSQSFANVYSGNKLTLYADATSPGGTPITQVTFPSNSNTSAGISFSMAFFDQPKWTLLSAGTAYRFVHTPSSALTVPRKLTINGSPDANVLAACLPFGNMHWTEQSGSTWDDSQTASLCELGPILMPADSTGGGGQVSYGFSC